MAVNLVRTSRKLCQALNARGDKITFNTKQFMGNEGRVHTYYSINRAVWNPERNKYYHEELYSSSSMVRITLYLRDMWYKVNGWELPTDQEQWNNIRKGLEQGDTNG